MGVLLPTGNQMFANPLQLLINFDWLHGGLAVSTCHKETMKQIFLLIIHYINLPRRVAAIKQIVQEEKPLLPQEFS